MRSWSCVLVPIDNLRTSVQHIAAVPLSARWSHGRDWPQPFIMQQQYLWTARPSIQQCNFTYTCFGRNGQIQPILTIRTTAALHKQLTVAGCKARGHRLPAFGEWTHLLDPDDLFQIRPRSPDHIDCLENIHTYQRPKTKKGTWRKSANPQSNLGKLNHRIRSAHFLD